MEHVTPICAGCENKMEGVELTGYMNQYPERIVYSLKPETPGALPVHVHKDCRARLPVTLKCNERGVGV